MIININEETVAKLDTIKFIDILISDLWLKKISKSQLTKLYNDCDEYNDFYSQ